MRGFKFHGIMQVAHPAERMAYPIYEVIAEHKLPAIFHTSHSGMGTGMRRGGGVRLKYGQPMLIDDVAIELIQMSVDRGRHADYLSAYGFGHYGFKIGVADLDAKIADLDARGTR